MKTTSAVKNPLTVIAIFAGLAEVAGTVVLPFVAETNQLTYIWFLMVFPTLLVLLFFLTLNKNPKVLYAPSDFRDESNYMKIFRPSSTTERLVKLENEVQESIDEEPIQEVTITKDNGTVETKNAVSSQLDLFERMSSDPRNRYMLAENLIIDRLSAEFRMPAQRELALRKQFGTGYLFDAIFEDKRGPIIVEIKFLPEKSYTRRLRETLKKMEHAVSSLPDIMRRNTRVLLVFAHERPNEEVAMIKKELNEMVRTLSVPIEIRMYNLKELITEAGIQ